MICKIYTKKSNKKIKTVATINAQLVIISYLYFIMGLFIPLPLFAQEQLIFSIDVIRHGDRTPLIVSPEMEKIWPKGFGQLTPKGMRQAYELGKLLRQQYVHQFHLLPEQYDIHTMTVRSSATARTMMTAQSILLGLYPLGTGPSLTASHKALPNGFQPIPIYTVPRKQDSLLIPNHDKTAFKQLLQTYIVGHSKWIKTERQLQPYYLKWSKIFGLPINHLFDLIRVHDRLFIERLYERSLPNQLQDNENKMIYDASTWAFLYIANHPKLAAIAGKELAQTITQELTLATQPDRPLKYLLFVAHDTTLLAQLKLLGQPLHEIPPYVSRINYALFDRGASKYEVRVTYNQHPLFIERCGGERCALNEFITLVNEHLNL